MSLHYYIGTSGWHAVYVYFNNDAEAFAVSNAITLGGYLKKAS